MVKDELFRVIQGVNSLDKVAEMERVMGEVSRFKEGFDAEFAGLVMGVEYVEFLDKCEKDYQFFIDKYIEKGVLSSRGAYACLMEGKFKENVFKIPSWEEIRGRITPEIFRKMSLLKKPMLTVYPLGIGIRKFLELTMGDVRKISISAQVKDEEMDYFPRKISKWGTLSAYRSFENLMERTQGFLISFVEAQDKFSEQDFMKYKGTWREIMSGHLDDLQSEGLQSVACQNYLAANMAVVLRGGEGLDVIDWQVHLVGMTGSIVRDRDLVILAKQKKDYVSEKIELSLHTNDANYKMVDRDGLRDWRGRKALLLF